MRSSPILLDLAHERLGPPLDIHLGGPGLDGVEHAPLEVVAGAQDSLDPRDLQVPVFRLEGLEGVGDAVAVGGEELVEELGGAPRLLDGGADLGAGEGLEEVEGDADVVDELVDKRVGAAEAGALVADGGEVADEELVGEDLDEDVDEGVVEDLAVVGDVLLEGDDHLLHGGAGVPLRGEEVGHDLGEVDGEDDLGEAGDAPGAEVDVAVAEAVHLRLDALRVSRGDVRLEGLAPVGQVGEAALVLVVVDAGDLVVGRGHEPVLQGLEALELLGVAAGGDGLVARGLGLEHVLPGLLPVVQTYQHGVNNTFDNVSSLRVGCRVHLLLQHTPQGHQVLRSEVSVLVLVKVGAALGASCAPLGEVALLLGEDTLDPLVEELDNELSEVTNKLSLTVVDDMRHKLLLPESQLSHLLVVLLWEANNFKAGVRVIHDANQEVVHEPVVDIGICLGNLPSLGHQRRHPDLDHVEVVEEPLHDLLEIGRVLEELLAGLLKVLLRAELDGLHELVLVPADVPRAVRDPLEAHGHLPVVLERLLHGQDALVALLLGVDHDGEAHHETVVLVDHQVDQVEGDEAHVLVEPLNGVVQPGEVILQGRFEARVVGSLDLLHGIVADIPQQGELVVAGQEVGHVLFIVVVLLQHPLHDSQPAAEGLEVVAHGLDGVEVAVGLRHEVDAGKVLDHVLRLGAELVDLDHLVLDHLDRLLAVAQAVHARLGQLELLPQTGAELAVDGRLLT
ncbi:unnamed protein product [Clonostachys byssicola]|uniref:Uncharacterized protein n=1 Tax=Clonostachys byssicola TaxID=160290 RepID=A0A9N9U2Q7_9HYPO|nr:unnamed protein product [Clonostachys byssicola]